MINNSAAYKYEAPFNFPFLIMRCFINSMVNKIYGPTEIRHNLCHIKACKSDTKIEDINPEHMYDDVRI